MKLRYLIYSLALGQAFVIAYLTYVAVDHPFTNETMAQAYEHGCLLGQNRVHNPTWTKDGYCFRFSEVYKEKISEDEEK